MDVEARLQHLERQLVCLRRRERRWWLAAVIALGAALACKAGEDRPDDYVRKGEPIVVGRTSIDATGISVTDGSARAAMTGNGVSVEATGKDVASVTMTDNAVMVVGRDGVASLGMKSLRLTAGQTSTVEIEATPTSADVVLTLLDRHTASLRADDRASAVTVTDGERSAHLSPPDVAPAPPKPPGRNDVLDVPEVR